MRGRDISRYEYSFADLWLINTHNGIKECGIPPVDINDYPAIKAHLDTYWDKISKRYDKGDTPYNLRNCIYTDDFSKQKIVWGNLCLSAQFAWVEDEYFINAPSPMIIGGNKYLLGVLNSKISDWYIRQLGVTRNGGYFEYKPMFVELTPIPKIDLNIQRKIETLADKIIENKLLHKDTVAIENEIDSIMYQVYDLSNDEIMAISLSFKE